MASGCVRLQLFDGFRAQVTAHSPVTIPPRQAGVLLAYLALFPARIHSREELIERFWPDDGVDEARHKLRKSLSAIRQILPLLDACGEHVLVTTRSTVHLNADLIETDVVAFESLIRDAGRACDPQERVRLLSEAASLYQGELLPGFYHDDLIAERNRLSETFQRALLSLIEGQEQIGDLDGALVTSRRLISLDPLVEESHVHVMRLYAALGQPAAVQRQYQELSRVLRAELGVAPSEETKHILDSLVNHARGETMARAAQRTEAPQNPEDAAASQLVASRAESPAPSPAMCDAAAKESTATPRSRRSRKYVTAVLLAVLPATASLALTLRHHAAPKPPAASVAGVAPRGAAVSAPGELPGLAPDSRTTLVLPHLVTSLPRPPSITARARRSKPATARHASSGKLLWAATYTPDPDESDNEPAALTTDAAGSIYVTGLVQTRDHDTDILTMKRRSDGKLVWKRRWNNEKSNDCDRGRYIALDAHGNIYVTGDTYGGDRAKGGTDWDIVTLKYAPDGTLLWAKAYNDPGSVADRPDGLGVDASGNAYVAGRARQADGIERFVLLRYSPAGALVWAEQPTPAPEGLQVGNRSVSSFVNDGEGNLYITGSGETTDAARNRTIDVYTCRYDRHGNQVWQRRFTADESPVNVGRVVTVDRAHNVYVAATVHPAVVSRGRTGEDMAVVKYDPSGTEVWSTLCSVSVPPDSLVLPNGLAVDSAGNVFAACQAGPSGYMRTFLVYAFTPDGHIRWHDAAPHLERSGMVVGPDGGPGVSASADYGGPHDFHTALLTWRYTAQGRRAWLRSLPAAPGHAILQRCLQQDSGGNLITAGQTWRGSCPTTFLLKYSM